jgi:capsular polysaccharide biosynthesis protein
MRQALKWTRQWLRPAKRGLSSLLRALPVSSATLGPPKGVLESLTEWLGARQPAGTELTRVTEPRPIDRSPPKTVDSKVPDCFRPFLHQLHPAGRVARIEGARLLHLGVVTPDDYLIRDLSFHRHTTPEELAWILSAVKLPGAVRVRGDLTVIGERFAASYYHWLFHALGRLCYVEKRYPLEKIQHFAVSHLDESFHRDTLQLLGIPQKKILPMKEVLHVQPDALIVANWTGGFDPTVAEWLRERFLSRLTPASIAGPKRIYVSRGRIGRRHIENETELLEVLRPLGFQTVFCEDLTFQEQMRLFHDAEVIVTPHGAGLSNLLFCRPGTKVIEIFNRGWRPEIFWQLSEAMGLDHYCLFAEEPAAADPKLAAQHRNILVSLDELRKLLELAGL